MAAKMPPWGLETAPRQVQVATELLKASGRARAPSDGLHLKEKGDHPASIFECPGARKMPPRGSNRETNRKSTHRRRGPTFNGRQPTTGDGGWTTGDDDADDDDAGGDDGGDNGGDDGDGQRATDDGRRALCAIMANLIRLTATADRKYCSFV